MPDTATDHAALTRAVLEHPGEDTPRLVLADWLETDAEQTAPCPRCEGTREAETFMMAGPHDKALRKVPIGKQPCRMCDADGSEDPRGWVPSGAKERAAFIRVQCDLARLESARDFGPACSWGGSCVCESHERLRWLRQRERELWEADRPLRGPHRWFGVPGSAPNVMLHGPGGCWIHTTVGGARVEWGIRRGLVDELRVPTLGVLFGGECLCVAQGGEPWPTCPACKGEGTLPGIAAAVWAAHPVTACVVGGLEPYPSDQHPGWFRWFTDDVPREVYALLVGEYPESKHGRARQPYWRTASAALLALSDASCAAGRRRAGLGAG